MAPEFIPFLVCAGLVAATLLAGAVALLITIVPGLRRRSWPLPAMAWGLAGGLALSTGVCAMGIRQAFFLDEPMAGAACTGNVKEARDLIDRGASPNACNVDCNSPALVCAAAGGHLELVQVLLDHGANINATDSSQKSAIERARENGHAEVVDLLEQRSRVQ